MKIILKRLTKYIKPYRRYFILTLICSVVQVAGTLFIPILIGKAVDCAVGKGNVDFNSLFSILKVMAVVIVAVFIFQWAASQCINRFSVKAIKDLRCDVFSHIQKVPIKFIDCNKKGDIIQRTINDIEIVSDGLLQGFTQLISGVLTILGTLIFMIIINYKIAIVVAILTPLSLFVSTKITNMSRDAFIKQSALRGELNSVAEEMIENQKIIKGFNYEDKSIEKFEKYNQEMKTVGARATFYSSLTNPATRFVNSLIYAAVGCLGALSAVGAAGFIGVLTIGEITSFLTYANQYTKPFNEISGVLSELQNAAASAERVFQLLDEPTEKDDSHLPSVENVDGSLKADDVTFSYLPTQKLITAFNLNVKPNQKIAIVGPTGCGKTTIINLILRFYDVNEGKILIGSTDVKTITRDSLRKCFGMVLQDSWLFSGTIADNIAYSRPDATREEIISAAKSAYADSFIRRLPDGYDTVIHSNGDNLSQGQKQLLCIARIMLINPPFLILDEATSNIDLRTEQKIQQAFADLMKNKTSFIIAHRLSTIKNADKILVMDNGEIIEQGTHDDLINLNGFYTKLYNSQFENV
jgi:ATP-binding cassette subfamily B protein